MDPSSPASSRKRDRGEDELDSQEQFGNGLEEAIEDTPFPNEDDGFEVADSEGESEGEDLFGEQLDRHV